MRASSKRMAGRLMRPASRASAICAWAFSSSGGSGLEFTAANFGTAVNPDTVTYTDAQVVDYLRGKRTGEGDIFRIRSALMGAVVNSEPVLAREEQTVYVASGEGMLHAFDTVTGNEQWAYMPQDKLAAIGQSVQRGWVYSTLLDATPSYGKLSSGAKMLVGGLGAAGRSYYALDVTSLGGVPLVARISGRDATRRHVDGRSDALGWAPRDQARGAIGGAAADAVVGDRRQLRNVRGSCVLSGGGQCGVDFAEAWGRRLGHLQGATR